MLFNTLANLRVLIGIDPPRAQAMLDRLIAFLRATLNASRSGSHPLAAEFDAPRRLPGADGGAHGRRGCGTRSTCPTTLRELPVPPLLLQPLVENASSTASSRKVEGGRIDGQRARATATTLVLRGARHRRRPVAGARRRRHALRPDAGARAAGHAVRRARLARRSSRAATPTAARSPRIAPAAARLRAAMNAHRPDRRRRTAARRRACAPSCARRGRSCASSPRVGDGDSAVRAGAGAAPAACCFLDIRMPGIERPRGGAGAGRGLAGRRRRFRCWCSSPPTTSTRCRPSSAQAVDYLLKPVQPRAPGAACVARLQARAGRARADAGRARCSRRVDQLRAPARRGAPAAPPPRRGSSVIQASVGNAVHLVPVDEVLYFEAADKYVRVVTAEREHLIRTSLRELLPQLDAQRFWQVHRGTVVRARRDRDRGARRSRQAAR